MALVSSVILETSLSLAFWTSLYTVFCKRDPSKSYEWHCRVVTLIHGIICVTLTSWCAFVQGPWPFTDPGGPMTPLQHFACTISLGYFLFDCGWCLYFQTEGFVMISHHIMSILGNTVVLIKGANGTEMIAALWGSELTNPFLQLRWFLREKNLHLTWYGELNDVLFIVLFGFLRIGVGSVLLHAVCSHKRPDFFTKFGGCCLYFVSWIFWIAILKYAYRKYRKRYAAWKYRSRDEQVAKDNKYERSRHRSVTDALIQDTVANVLNSGVAECHNDSTARQRSIRTPDVAECQHDSDPRQRLIRTAES